MKKMKIQSQSVILTEDGQKNQYYKISVYETFRMITVVFGILLCIQDLMYSTICLLISFVTAMIVLVIRQISYIWDRWIKNVDLILYFVGLISFALSNLSLIQAIFDVANRFIILYNLRFDRSFERFAVDGRAATGAIFLWILISLIISNYVYRQIKAHKLYAILLMLILSSMFGFILGTSSMLLQTFLVLVSILNLFVYNCAPKREIGMRFFICKLSSLTLMILFLLASSIYIPSKELDTWKKSVNNKIDELRYGKDSLPKGDFSKASNLLIGSEKRLSLHVDDPQELYLKGFVGATYQSTQWNLLSNDHYEGKYEGILKWLALNKFDPLTQYASYEKISTKQNASKLNSSKVHVKNTGAYRKYVYLPTTTLSFQAFRVSANKDSTIQSNRILGTSDYNFQVLNTSGELLDLIPASWLGNAKNTEQKTYLQTESVYDKFVKDSYKDINLSIKKLMKTTFFKDQKKMSFKEITTRIRQVLRQKLKYTTNPSETNSEKDYITWLLNDKKEGNAISYATIAVMAYRSAGYPARYVEGYHLSKDEALKLTKQNKKNVILTTKNAHAWVEVYRSGIGWIPVEVVPGMYTETYSTQTVQGKPSYKLKSQKDKSGINTEQKSSKNHKKDKKKEKKSHILSVQYISTIFLILLYAFLILYLFLEFQRALRLYLWGKQKKEEDFVTDCAEFLEKLWILSKIKGDYSHPFHLETSILDTYPQVTSFEYQRVVSLIQKSRFGGKTLKTYEKHTLISFIYKISNLLWRKQTIFGKIALRYIYIIPKK